MSFQGACFCSSPRLGRKRCLHRRHSEEEEEEEEEQEKHNGQQLRLLVHDGA